MRHDCGKECFACASMQRVQMNIGYPHGSHSDIRSIIQSSVATLYNGRRHFHYRMEARIDSDHRSRLRHHCPTWVGDAEVREVPQPQNVRSRFTQLGEDLFDGATKTWQT